ncbi:YebC/PmpR family DNA-binding transcriptional regulator, partial [Methylocaldum sp.]|uniref:YebC/PmpR family DNA-binding transcriptional regulator n=1 Tax=Methylocaldum sp. TaxID=1969727 RepID=UPI00321FB8C6
PDQFETVRDTLAQAGLAPESAEVTMRASTSVALDKDDAEKMIRLLERLEDLDDVQNVYSNADISEEILAQIG